MPDVSLVLPFRNEEAFLRRTLETLAAQDLGPFTAEVLMIDGDSEDRSPDIAREFAERPAGAIVFRLLRNPARRTPAAFNLGIREARGAVVGLGGAHTDYPPRYLRRAIEMLQEVDADVVGGGHDHYLPAGDGALAAAMSCLYESPMGDGVAAYHRRQAPGYVDTVYGGFYRRAVFDRVGYFDEQLVRNQDNELNARVTSAGFRVYFHPDLSTTYIQKTDPQTFLKRGFLFGRYHPATWRTNPQAFRLRHAVPALFVAYLLALAIASGISTVPVWWWGPLVAYALLLVVAAGRLMHRRRPVVGLLTIPLFFFYHLSYGAGTLVGLAARR
jgi:succinoglycan biosynthesis protein ExoA